MSWLERLYAAIDDEAAYAEMPTAIALLCSGRSCVLTRISKDGTILYGGMNYFPAEVFATYYTDGWVNEDPWAIAGGRSPGRACLVEAVLPPEKFRETAMYNELVRPTGDDTARCAAIVLPGAGGLVQFGIHRAASAAAFAPENAARIEAAMVHLRRIFRARDTLAEARGWEALATEALDRAGRMLLLVDTTLRIRRMTDGARRLADRQDGVRHAGGRLWLDDAHAHQRLAAAVDGAVNGRTGAPDTLLCPQRAAVRPLRISVLPAGAHAPGCALVMIDDPAARPCPDRLGRFARAYGLTAMEARLAEGLAADRTLDEIAAERRVTKETIRAQLRSLFLKTGVRRQGELIRLIVQMP